MARSLNRVSLIGNLGTDPNLYESANGTPVCNFSLATNESVPAGDGQYEEKTEWHRIVAFGKLAEIACNHLKKGRQVFIEGRLHTAKWIDRDDITRWTTEIVAQEFLFLGGGAEGQGAKSRNGGSAAGDNVSETGGEEEIPF